MCKGKAYYRHHGGHRHHHRGFQKWAQRAWNTPPVNVKELDDRYELMVFAAGYEKADFQVQVVDHQLLISVEKQESDIVDSPNWRRREFTGAGFERRFEMNDKIDADGIRADYKEGILMVTLPKKAGFETKRQDIQVA